MESQASHKVHSPLLAVMVASLLGGELRNSKFWSIPH